MFSTALARQITEGVAENHHRRSRLARLRAHRV